jgi:hypothetical protein
MDVSHLLMGERLSRPSPRRDARGIWRRDPSPVWDWLYHLDDGTRLWVIRHLCAPYGQDGTPPDVVATMAGYDDYNAWTAAVSQHAERGRERQASRDWDQLEPDAYDVLLGPDELASLLQVNRGTIRQWRHRGILPEPDMVLSSLPIWTLATIRDWAAYTGRTTDQPETK